MTKISTKHNKDIHIYVGSLHADKVNLYMQDRHVGVDAHLSVKEAEALIKGVQESLDEIKGRGYSDAED